MACLAGFVFSFLSTLSLRRATTKSDQGANNHRISIHALLAESDGVTVLGIQHKVGISIHALLAESDHFICQSPCVGWLHFYPRSPCGERQRFQAADISARRISIHALLAESDVLALCSFGGAYDFYPRSPCGERPRHCAETYQATIISIHALLAESDEMVISVL